MSAILAGLAADGVLGSRPVIAFDGRAGSRELAFLACDLLAELGLRCLLGDEPSPTPALGHFVRDNADATSGITFTASHNPAGYVGMKIRDAEGLSIDVPPTGLAPVSVPRRHEDPPLAPLNAHYAATAGRDLLASLRDFDGQVVIDAAHGALGALTRLIPGVTWQRSRLLPFFCGITPDPVVPENIEASWQSALSAAAQPEGLLVAFSDGDGDRLVLATARSGYISSTEQAAIACRAGLSAALVIATVVTPRLVRQTARSRQMAWLEVPVGFKHVAGAWRAHGRPEALGLEPNGALAYAAGQHGYFERDSLRALALVTRLYPSIAAIDDAVAALREEYPSSSEMITSPMSPELVLRHLSAELTGWEAEQADHVSSFTRGAWRILVRPSGTEKATRIYLEATPEITEQIKNSIKFLKPGRAD